MAAICFITVCVAAAVLVRPTATPSDAGAGACDRAAVRPVPQPAAAPVSIGRPMTYR